MPEKFPKLRPEKQEVIVRHPEPIKIPKKFTRFPEKVVPKIERQTEKDALDKVLDVLENAENKLIKEGAVNLIGKGISKSADVLIKKPVKKAFGGVWENFKKLFKKETPEEYEKMEIIEMPKSSSIENEAESLMDLSRPGVTKKELGEEVAKIEKQGLTAREKEGIALSRLKKKR